MSALALDRQAIEKKDFPISRRGYEPEAVDIHLEGLAGEVERLQGELDRTQRAAATAGAPPAPARSSGTQSLALAASEQVRMIVEAAESSAGDIERSAEEEAARIRAEADTEARRIRDEAVARSQEQVGGVGEATSAMLQRVDAMEGELGALVESLRTGTNRLTADLSLLQGNLGDLYGAAGSSQAPAPPRPTAPGAVASVAMPAGQEAPVREPAPASVSAPAREPASAPEPPAAPEPTPAAAIEPELASELEAESSTLVDEPVAVAPAATAAPPEPPTPPAAVVPAEHRQSNGDVEGARLIALNMALNGQSREETDSYLRDNFDLDDRGGLLDEVYATVEG